MLDVFPAGFEERPSGVEIELAGYAPGAEAAATRALLVDAHESDVAPGWETAWQRFHQPVQIGDLWLGPPWAVTPSDVTAVTITPGMAFGTGAHPTTRLCIELLLAEVPGPLVDLGCGSGVLAVVARVLGFEPVIAVDKESVAIEETLQNARANDVVVDARHGDLGEFDVEQPSLVIANLPLPEIRRMLVTLRPVRAIVAGFRIGELPALAGYRVSERREQEGWEAARLERVGCDDYP